MTEAPTNVLPKCRRLTQSFAKATISRAITGTQHKLGLTDQDLADVLGCSAGTVQNGRNQSGMMQIHTFFELLSVNEKALEGFLNFYGMRSVPIEAKCDTDALATTSGAVHKLAVVTSEASPGGKAILDSECLEIEPDIDAAIATLSNIKQRCHEIRERAA